MISSFRKFSKSWVAAAILGTLALGFVVVQQTDVFHPTLKGAVVSAGDRSVTPADFKREFDRAKAGAEQQNRRPISLEEAVTNGLDRQLLTELTTRESFLALLDKIGVRPSDKLIAEQYHSIPAFFDQITGKFDKKLYEERLASNGLTSKRFEQEIRDELAESQVSLAMVHGLRIPRAYAALAAIYGLERRDIGYFEISPTSVPMPARPTDAQLTQLMKENAGALTQPEFRVLSAVVFSPGQFAATMPIDPAELQKRYEFRRDTVSAPETRSVIQIPAKDQAGAQAIAARLAKGEDPAAIAKSAGVDVITHTDKPLSAFTDHKIGAAAFALKAGETSGPVQGDLGLAVLKVAKVTPGHTVSLEELRPQLEAEIRKDAATEKVYELTQTYEDARDSGANLIDAAKKAGVQVVTLQPISRQGTGMNRQPVPGIPPKLLEAGFSLPSGGESDLLDAGQGEYYAVRVEKIIPSALPPLADVRPQLEAYWMNRALLQALTARANKFQEELKAGKTLEAVATEAGSSVTRVVALDRQSAGQSKALSQDALIKAFGAKPGATFVAQDVKPGLIVAKVEGVHPPTGPAAARIAEDSRPQLTMALFQELGESARQAAKTKIKATSDYNAARTALGLEPIVVTKAKSGKDEKTKKPELAK